MDQTVNYYAIPGISHPTVIMKRPLFTVGNSGTPAEEIIRKIASYYKVPYSMVIGYLRDAKYVRARHMSFYFLRRKTTLSYPEIAGIFNAHHSTIIVGERKILDQLAKKTRNHDYAKDVSFLDTFL